MKPPLPNLVITGSGVGTTVQASIDLRAVVWAAMREDMDGILLDEFARLFWQRWDLSKPGRVAGLDEEFDDLVENLDSKTLDFFEHILTAAGRLEEPTE